MNFEIKIVKFTLFATCSVLLTNPAFAAPEGGQVIHGQATIDQNGSITNIVTESHNTTIVFDRFNVAEDEGVNIFQPNADSHTLNYVPGNQNPITVRGTLWSNGQISLVSPGGVIFGENAIVDVGALHAAAAQIGDFENLKNLSNLSKLEGNVENYGTINAETIDLIGKNVVNAGNINASIVNLVGKYVQNTGAIYAPDGMIGMIIADEVYTSQEGSRLFVNLGAPADQGQAEIENTGTLDAENGAVLLGAGDVYSLAIRNSGVIRAKEITLDAGDKGLVSIERGSVLDASGLEEGEVGGAIKVLGQRIGLFAGSKLDASGVAGGGIVNVGGGFQGKDPSLGNAMLTYVAKDAEIRADALNSGNGGEVIVWADGLTHFDGFISARGGDLGGDGGFAEVSGKETLQFFGSADLSAISGWQAGNLLLDPRTIRIVEFVIFGDGEPNPNGDINGDGSFGDDFPLESPEGFDVLDETTDFSGLDSIITNDALNAFLGSSEGGETLTLFADVSITVDAPVGNANTNTDLIFKTQQLDINKSVFVSSSSDARFEPANANSPTIVNVNANSNIDIFGGNARDTITVAEGVELNGFLGGIDNNDGLGAGDDSLILLAESTMRTGGISFSFGEGDDVIVVGENANLFSADGLISMGEGNDTVVVNEGANLTGGINTGNGNDIIRMQGGSSEISFAYLDTGNGDDTVLLTGALSGFDGEGRINTGNGNDTVRFLGDTDLTGNVYTEDDNDTVQFSGATILGFEGEGFINTGSGDDTIAFSGAATLDGSINGGDEGDISFIIANVDSSIDSDNGLYGIVESGFDTLDFTASSLATAVDPGGGGPVIIYDKETSGTTVPNFIISGGFSNINRVLFASETLIPPTQPEEHNDKEEEFTPLIERENYLIFNRMEAPIEDALIEELARLGIYARNNTLEETQKRFKGSAEFVQKIETDQPSMADFKVATGRTEKMRIQAILEAYYELTGSEGMAPIRKNLQQVLKDYYKDSGDMTGEGFRTYIEERQGSELYVQALRYLNGYQKLFTKIETAGLTPREIEISKFVLLRGIRVRNFSHKELYEAIRAESEWQL